MTSGVRVFLDGVKDRLAKATPGPWFVDRYGEFNRPHWQIPNVLRDRYGANPIGSEDRATIEFIAAAPSDVSALVAAVEAVLALHKRIEVPYSASMLTSADGTVTSRSTTKATCDYCSRTHVGGGEFVGYPCPTVRAVAAHLDPGETT